MKKSFNQYKNQNGLVLIIVLIMVPVVFMLSYTSINKLTVGERATTNVVDRGNAFYSAEMAIADAETWMKSGKEPFVGEFTEQKFNLSAQTNKGFYPINADVDINDLLTPKNIAGVFKDGYYKNNIADPLVEIQIVPGIDPNLTQVPTNILSTLHDPAAYIVQLVDISECVLGMKKNRALFKVTARGWGVQENTMVTLENFFSLNFDCPEIPIAI